MIQFCFFGKTADIDGQLTIIRKDGTTVWGTDPGGQCNIHMGDKLLHRFWKSYIPQVCYSDTGCNFPKEIADEPHQPAFYSQWDHFKIPGILKFYIIGDDGSHLVFLYLFLNLL